MITILSCNGYKVEATATTLREAVVLCRELEVRASDSFARVILDNGTLVGDCEGLWRYSPGAPPYDSATATGMYDQ